MKNRFFAIATLLALAAGSVYALDRPCFNQGTGQKSGQRKGKKVGPQDGSGPIHEPGTGGGTGTGQRGPRK